MTTSTWRRARADWRAWPIAEWPGADAAAWRQAMKTAGPFESPGPAAKLREPTRRTMVSLYGQLLGWLARNGELDPNVGPAERVTAERIGRFLRERREAVAAFTVFTNLRMLSMMMTCLAPAVDWRWLAHHPAGPRRREAMAGRRSHPTVDVGRLVHGLLQGLAKLQSSPPSLAVAVQRRDHLLVAIATYLTPRLNNLRRMVIDVNLVRRTTGWDFLCDPDETKTGVPMAMQIPANLVPHLRLYLDVDRPRLLAVSGQPSNSLWISREGMRLAEASMHRAFQKLSLKLIGQQFSPHDVRHVAATTLLAHDPNAVEMAASILTHSGAETVSRFYDHSGREPSQLVWRKLTEKFRQRPDDADLRD